MFLGAKKPAADAWNRWQPAGIEAFGRQSQVGPCRHPHQIPTVAPHLFHGPGSAPPFRRRGNRNGHNSQHAQATTNCRQEKQFKVKQRHFLRFVSYPSFHTIATLLTHSTPSRSGTTSFFSFHTALRRRGRFPFFLFFAISLP